MDGFESHQAETRSPEHQIRTVGYCGIRWDTVGGDADFPLHEMQSLVDLEAILRPEILFAEVDLGQ